MQKMNHMMYNFKRLCVLLQKICNEDDTFSLVWHLHGLKRMSSQENGCTSHFMMPGVNTFLLRVRQRLLKVDTTPSPLRLDFV